MLDLSSAKSQKERIDIISKHLETGMEKLFSSEHYKNYLQTLSKFHQYSANNCLLIYIQSEGKATLVNSYTGWKSLGRYPDRGQKGMTIICPTPFHKEIDKEVKDGNGNPVLDADGKPQYTKETLSYINFRTGTVFDVSQTSGKELELLQPKLLDKDVENYDEIISALVKAANCDVSFEKIEGNAYGYYDAVNKKIVVEETLPQLAQIKTLAHEIGHERADELSILHNLTREENELLAESTAFVVSEWMGFDTSEYSFEYIGAYSKNGISSLRPLLSEIQKCSNEIITSLNKELHIENEIQRSEVKHKTRTA